MDISIGLVGAGRMGAVYARQLANGIGGAKLLAVADINEPQAATAAAQAGKIASYPDHRALLARQDLDAVIIATPTNTHAEIIRDAAEAGKHIFCEKPLALTLEDCDAAITATQKAKVKLQVGFMRRFDRAYAAAKQKIEEGLIGVPVMFKATSRDPNRSTLEYARRANSGGMFIDLAIHDFDIARWLMASEVVRVHSEGGCLVFPELNEVGDIDNAVINLQFASGAIGNVDASRNAVYGYDIRAEVIGSEGSLMIGSLQQTRLLVLTPAGVTHDTIPFFMERFGEAYRAEIRDFVSCIVEDRAPAVTGRDGRAATAMGIAATRSFDEQRAVKLSEIEPPR